MSTPESRLADLGITLPEPMAAVANYVPFVISGQQLFVTCPSSLSVLEQLNTATAWDSHLASRHSGQVRPHALVGHVGLWVEF